MIFTTITYTLPKIFGVHVHYYHLVAIPAVLEASLGTVATARIIKFFAKRDQRAGAPKPGDDLALDEDDAVIAEETSWADTFFEQLNILILAVLCLGCELPVAFHMLVCDELVPSTELISSARFFCGNGV